MSATQVQVTFDPSGNDKNRFSFSPVRSFMNGETAAVLFQISTRGGAGRSARFAEPGGSRWSGPFASAQDLEQGPEVTGLTQVSAAGRTSLEVGGFPRNDSDRQQVYEYVVTVDYEGETYTSRPGYPSTTCTPTGGNP